MHEDPLQSARRIRGEVERSWTMRRAFVTGATGFIGSHVVKSLLAEGVEVRALVRPGPSGEVRVPPQSLLTDLKVELVPGDLQRPDMWCQSLGDCEVVFHVAAFYSSVPTDHARLYAVNVGGTQTLLRAAADAGVQRVVHTSTIGTIGQQVDHSPATEDTPFNLWRSSSHYVRSKWLGETVALWWNNRGLPVTVVHPTAPIGPGDWKPTATGQRILDFLAGKRPDYVAGAMNLCPVPDIAAGHVLAARRGQAGRRYILGLGNGNLTEAGFLRLLSQVTGLPVPSSLSRGRYRRPYTLVADPRRAVEELGVPQSDLRTALAEAVAWYLEMRVRQA